MDKNTPLKITVISRGPKGEVLIQRKVSDKPFVLPKSKPATPKN